jgi:hypothetical protein
LPHSRLERCRFVLTLLVLSSIAVPLIGQTRERQIARVPIGSGLVVSTIYSPGPDSAPHEASVNIYISDHGIFVEFETTPDSAQAFGDSLSKFVRAAHPKPLSGETVSYDFYPRELGNGVFLVNERMSRAGSTFSVGLSRIMRPGLVEVTASREQMLRVATALEQAAIAARAMTH